MANRCTLYVGGLDETVTEAVVHAAFLPFGVCRLRLLQGAPSRLSRCETLPGEIKDVNLPMDHGTQKNRGFGFVTFQEACVPRRLRPGAWASHSPAETTRRLPWTICTTRSCTDEYCAAT